MTTQQGLIVVKPQILFVDDQPNVLAGLRRSLRAYASQWDMEFVDSGAAALERLAGAPFDLIITDIRMPGMDGIELLTRVRQLYPHIVRIVLSGQCDHETALRAVGSTHQFLSKPCDTEVLHAAIVRACASRARLLSPAIQKLLSDIPQLPSIPALYAQITQELKSSEPSVARVGQLISQDLGMSARILQLINSSFFGLPRQVSTPAQAVSLLGTETIAALVLSAGLFSKYQAKGTASDMGHLASHGLVVGTLAKRIAEKERAPHEICNRAFLGGLLHDIGKLVLLGNFPSQYERVLRPHPATTGSLLNREFDAFGATHCELGGYLLGIWGMPDEIVAVASFHHAPSNATSHGFDALTAVHVANAFLDEEDSSENSAKLDDRYLLELGLLHRLPDWRDVASTMTAALGIA